MKKLLLLVLIGFLAACEQAVVEEVPTTYQITYELTHLNIQRRFSYDEGERLFLVPTQQDGYEFKGWFLDAALTIPFTDEVMPARNITLYPAFERVNPIYDLESEGKTPSQHILSISAPAEICKTPNAVNLSYWAPKIGFPLGKESLSSQGVVRIAVHYVDFNNYRWNSELSNYELTEFLIEPIQRYFDAMSGGQVKFEWTVYDEILSLPQDVEYYTLAGGKNQDPFRMAFDNYVKNTPSFETYDIVLAGIHPEVPEDLASTTMSLLGDPRTSYFMAVFANDTRRVGYQHILHDIMHMFGLADLYESVCATEDCNSPNFDWRVQFRAAGAWSLMSYAGHPHNELLGWERWLIGWLDDKEIHCINTTEEHVIEIIPSYSEALGTRLISIPLEEYVSMVVEMREPSRYCVRCNRGLLVYTVDTRKETLQAPLRVLRPAHSIDVVMEDALLRNEQGFNQLSHEGWLIEILEELNEGFLVRISNQNA